MNSNNVTQLRLPIYECEDITVRIPSEEIDSLIADYLKVAGYLRSDEEVMVLDTGLEVDEYGAVEFDVTVERLTRD